MTNYARLITVLEKLISYKTISGQLEEIDRCLNYIEDLVRGTGVNVSRHTSNGHQSLIISTTGNKYSRVILQSHIDVVPAYNYQFQLKQSGGKLFGRGVYDMKFAAACFLFLLEELRAELDKYDFAIMLTSDEELDGSNGVEYLINQGYGGKVCILPDSGEDWNIEAAAKGYAIAKVMVNGKSAHGSRPWEADNAAIKLLDFVHIMAGTFQYSSHLDTTVTPTLLSAGSAYNQIPGDATATFDIRFPTEAAYIKTKRHIKSLCDKFDARVQFTYLAQAVQHQTDGEFIELWQEATEKYTGKSPTFTQSFAASDARYLVPAGIPTISARPPGGGHHGSEEWLSEKDFYLFYEVLKHFMLHAGRAKID